MIRKIETSLEWLKRPCREVMDSEDIHEVLNDLWDTFGTFDDRAAGLSANQIGYDVRISLIKVGGIELVLINPTIRITSTRIKFREGCLSFPGISVETSRYQDIVVEYRKDEDRIQEAWTGLIAIAIQHEVDHLDGKTMFQRKWHAR